MALAIHGPSGGNCFASAARYFDFSVGRGASGEINHDGWLFLAGEGDGDGIGAEHTLRPPKRSDQFGCVGHGPADEVAFKGFEDVVAGNAEMVGVADADPTGTSFLGHVHGHAIGLWADNQTEAVVPIDGRRTQCRAQRLDLGFGIDAPFAEHFDVAIEPGHAVGINAPEVRAGKHIGSLRRILFGNPKVQKDASAEFAQGLDVKNLGL